MFRISQVFLLLISLLLAQQAVAGVVITGTRQIYLSNKKELTIKLDNNGSKPALVQTWIDDGDVNTTPMDSKSPFIITPPVFRLDPSKGQMLRVVYTGGDALPKDRESVFWLNVLEIPPEPTEKETAEKPNILQMAFRSRIKLFYRPATLNVPQEKAIDDITISQVDGKLKISNNSPYYVSLSNIETMNEKTERVKLKDALMLQPKSEELLTMDKNLPLNRTIYFKFINDYGAYVDVSKQLK